MMRGMTTLCVAAFLAAGCVDADEPGDDTSAETMGADAIDATGTTTLPPDDGDLQTIDVTLTEWSVGMSQASVAAGAVAFVVRNNGSAVHRFEVEGNGEEWASEDLNPGDEVTMSLNLAPGTYEVYCPVVADGTDHRAQGMSTTLRVE